MSKNCGHVLNKIMMGSRCMLFYRVALWQLRCYRIDISLFQPKVCFCSWVHPELVFKGRQAKIKNLETALKHTQNFKSMSNTRPKSSVNLKLLSCPFLKTSLNPASTTIDQSALSLCILPRNCLAKCHLFTKMGPWCRTHLLGCWGSFQ